MAIGRYLPFFEKCGDFRFECRQVIRDDTPDNGIIYPEIPVNDLVPERCHIPPWDILMVLFYRFRDIFRGFSDYFNGAPDRMSKIIIVDKIVKCPLFRYFSEENYLVKDVPDTDQIIPQSRSPPPQHRDECICQPPPP